MWVLCMMPHLISKIIELSQVLKLHVFNVVLELFVLPMQQLQLLLRFLDQHDHRAHLTIIVNRCFQLSCVLCRRLFGLSRGRFIP